MAAAASRHDLRRLCSYPDKRAEPRQLLTSSCRLLLRQRDHTAPELHELPCLDIVLAHKVELAVAADAIHAQTGRERGDRIPVEHGHRQNARRGRRCSTRHRGIVSTDAARRTGYWPAA